MGDRLRAGKPYRYVTSHLGQLNLPCLRGKSIEYRPVWLGLRRGVFTCVIPYDKWHSVAASWCIRSINSSTVPLPFFTFYLFFFNSVPIHIQENLKRLSRTLNWKFVMGLLASKCSIKYRPHWRRSQSRQKVEIVTCAGMLTSTPLWTSHGKESQDWK